MANLCVSMILRHITDFCKNAFASQAELQRHERREAKDFKYKCDNMEKKEQLDDHMGVHIGKRGIIEP